MVKTTGGIALTLDSLESTFTLSPPYAVYLPNKSAIIISEESEVNLMEMQVIVKVKLNLANADIASSFTNMMEQYRLACNYVSEYIFNHDFDMKQSRLNKALYTNLRSLFMLKSQMAQSVIRTVIARYKTVKTQMKRNPYKYQDVNTGEWYREIRDLTWLQKPIAFNRPQVDLQRNRDWSYLSSGQLSINTLDGRVKVNPICHGFDQYFDGTWSFGLAKLLKTGGKWYLHISATKTVADFDNQTVKHVVGIDRGLRFLATTYDEQGQTSFFDGKTVMRKRAKYQKLRAKLQAKGTKSAKRRLKKLSGRDSRFSRFFIIITCNLFIIFSRDCTCLYKNFNRCSPIIWLLN